MAFIFRLYTTTLPDKAYCFVQVELVVNWEEVERYFTQMMQAMCECIVSGLSRDMGESFLVTYSCI